MNRLALCKTLTRQLSTNTRAQAQKKLELHPVYLKVRQNYAKYQVNDGVPVHLKGGYKDYFLYGLTITMNIVGLAMVGEFFYRQAYK
ncbi:cytochrome c oxidase subunit 7A2, mitochondrial [Hyalella azteca]|uniref:Cytochrome c oxidase subunit 7A2, mitochondrial n=1 Tax=Hyalella azteca TaxID=294128 RepID=A0A8B7NMM6_HYAAZ|nr:cytochrome c oxidase subunit 7A2, mitochondrial [Hyalella azteca]